ncbi:hypothetical protein CONPUDRAFT_145746 [Coniophora puteana RWD-64-598 SS2]|uniref:F-box domain-containing protein n=1 Tax=Coniophora puteana (strain RWD-64-598) TaxID=741705 RepID=A0A5M3MI14_CONPW|nr:uncharacterized protein CONPUDRAFT_145746 [Coniophora puteana RWD-64-598 SS2]EIW78570.1 hypothetical protein CONPUDRAFT_145746 [Coniophora puteana RWD-64-598 SS2]
MTSTQPSILHRFPHELLTEIAVHLVALDPLGPPSALVPLFLTCKHTHATLTSSSSLFARIFRTQFDPAASARRLGPHGSHAPYLADQLKHYSQALSFFRSGGTGNKNQFVNALWQAYIMCLENDGRNIAQLEWAGAPDLVDRFVRGRLANDRLAQTGWPREDEAISLALWVMWFTSTPDRLSAEPTTARGELANLLLPLVNLPFRYAHAYAPAHHATLPLPSPTSANTPPSAIPHSIITAHGAYPSYAQRNVAEVPHFDRHARELCAPLASTAAKLIWFSRREVVPLGVPPHLPLNRAEAIANRRQGPTQADVRELTENKHARLVERGEWYDGEDGLQNGPSVRWDDDWWRAVDCTDMFSKPSITRTHYSYGLMRGLWQGRLLMPEETGFRNLLVTPTMPAGFSELNPMCAASPVFMRLREHHSIDPADPLAPGYTFGAANGIDTSLWRGWLPGTRSWVDSQHTMTIMSHGQPHTYAHYDPGRPSVHDKATCRGCLERSGDDVIIEREHDEEYIQDQGMGGQPASDEQDGQWEDESMSSGDEGMAVDATIEMMYESVGLGRRQAAGEEADVEMTDGSEASEEYCVRRRCDGVQDIVFSGETDLAHGLAWNHYRFLGRVRTWDGLVAILRLPGGAPLVANAGEPTDAHHNENGIGWWVFTGYVVGGRNFVGTWRSVTGGDPRVPGWEGAVVMSRRDGE